MKVKEVSYKAGGIQRKGYLAYDPLVLGKRPGVLVMHEWWGHNDYARKRVQMLAQMGDTALAVDMYGEGKQAAHPTEASQFAQLVLQNPETAKLRFRAAMQV